MDECRSGRGLNNKSIALFCTAFLFVATAFASPHIGIHPLDEKYFDSDIIKCKDGSKSFPRERLNDNFCDCLDGTDEPGTSACPAGKFYCADLGSKPWFIFSSRINDGFCDCCDGSDEYDSSVHCPKTCVMGGKVEVVEYKTANSISKVSILQSSVEAKERKSEVNSEDLLQKLRGLKTVIILQILFISLFVILRIIHRHFRSKRRRYH